MTAPRPTHADSTVERLSQARANQARNEIVQQARAVRTVEDHAIDSQDCDMLMAMLGLDKSEMTSARARYLGPLS